MGEGPASRLLALTISRSDPTGGRSTAARALPISKGMAAPVDDRLLERWQTSRRHQDEARRFLARQRFSDPRGERRALDEIVGTIAQLERTLQERAARRGASPPSTPGPSTA
jgi:hypothetical protein